MLKRKDGRWVEALTVDGKRKYVYGKTKKELQEKLRKIDDRRLNGKDFGEVLDEWVEEHFPTLVPATQKGYMPSVNRAKERFGDKSLKEIEPVDIQVFIRELANKGYSKKVVLTQMTVLRLAFDYAIAAGYLRINPCQAIKIPRGLPQKKRQLPCDGDIEVVSQSEWLLPYFLLYTGCRRGEALAITYEDINWEKKTISINKALGFDHNEPFIKPTKTESGLRTIPLLDNLAERLPRNKKGLIFNVDGEPYRETQFLRAWRAWQKKYNVSVTCHQLRHMYATILYDANIDPKDAQFLMGHSTITMTLDTYTHIRENRIVGSSQKLNTFVSSVSKPK